MSVVRFVSISLCLAISLAVVGCSSAESGTEQVAAKVVEQSITQAEAQQLWDTLARAYAGDEWNSSGSAVESATLSTIDLKSLMEAAWAEDINARVLAADPDALKFNTGEGQVAGYAEADPATRKAIVDALATAGSAEILGDYLLFMNADPDTGEYPAPPSIEDLPWQAFSVIRDAIVQPAQSPARVVAVEGTDTVLVTYKANMTFGNDKAESDWTNRYRVEMRDGKWVITSIENLGDYAVAVVKGDSERKKAAPSAEELSEVVNGGKVEWQGQDSKRLWYVAVGLSERSKYLVRRGETGEWEPVGNSSMDGGYWVGGVAPKEVIEQMEKAGLSVYE